LFDVDSITITTNKYINTEGVETASDYWGTSSYYGIKPNTTYSLQARSDNVYNIYVAEYDINKNFIQQRGIVNATSGSLMKGSFTTSAECRFIRICLPKNGSSSTAQFNTVQLELGNTSSDFEEYNGSTYTITFQDGSTPLTVYGGKLNVTTGVLTVDRKVVDLGNDKTWYYKDSGSQLAPYFWAYITDAKFKGATTTTNYDLMCSQYKSTKRSVSDFLNGCITFDGDASNVLQVQIKDDRYTDTATFKNGVQGVKLVYELKTPQTYQLTPTEVKTLLGQNNVWSDAGEVEVVYKADIQKYIDNAIATMV
jgi:hypothetical protein